jgi:hypothetical protein
MCAAVAPHRLALPGHTVSHSGARGGQVWRLDGKVPSS